MSQFRREPLGPKSDAVSGARSLFEAKERRLQRRFLVEGLDAVSAAADLGLLEQVFSTDDKQIEVGIGVRSYLINEAALKAISETVTPKGPVGVARIPEIDVASAFASARLVLIGDRISDPGNVGTIIRTAVAAGADLVVFTSGSADPWSGKVVRSTAGQFGVVPVIVMDSETLIAEIRNRDLLLLVTTADGDESLFDLEQRLRYPHAWVIGSEAHGVSDSFLERASVTVSIPMQANVESLNAAIAAGLCLYESARAQSRF